MEQNLKYWCSHGDPGNLSISNEMTPLAILKRILNIYISEIPTFDPQQGIEII